MKYRKKNNFHYIKIHHRNLATFLGIHATAYYFVMFGFDQSFKENLNLNWHWF